MNLETLNCIIGENTIIIITNKIKGLHRVKHDTNAECRQEEVEQVYIKSTCGHIILVDIVN